MKKTTFRLNKAMRETVDVDGLSDKIFSKYMKFVDTKVRMPGPHISPVGAKKVKIPKEPTRGSEKDEDMNLDRENLGSMVSPSTANRPPVQKSPTKRDTKRSVQEPAQPTSYIEVSSAATPAQDLDTSVMTVTSRYRFENQNSIYYLKPNTTDIYLLDFTEKRFLQEQLRWKRGQGVIPLEATTKQTSDATIFVVGGYRKAGPSTVALQDCLAIDANLAVYEREKMKIARYGAALALIRDRFLLALSGSTGDGQTTRHCEAYDTLTNHWFPMQNLPVGVTNTSTVVMGNRFVYLMPGSNQECMRGNDALLIHLLDSGSSKIFTGDKNDKTAGWPIGR